MNKNLESNLLAYANSDAYAFHMPGHKRLLNPIRACAENRGEMYSGGKDWNAVPDGQERSVFHADHQQRGKVLKADCDEPEKSVGVMNGGLAADSLLQLDITEIDGFDNLHDAQGILRDEMKKAAEMYGAGETLFSVNGSTCALLAAISAAVPKGGTILIERRSHMAVYHAAYLRELDVVYVENAGKSIDAVVITSPTYEGCMKDVAGWAEYAHANGAVLIVDEAHGAHLGFHPYFPESAVRCGADLVVQSTHKTLPAMTQTALLHNVTGRVPTRKLQFFMDIYETSSPSYVLMASITSSLRLVRERGEELFAAYAERLRNVRRELCSLKHFRLAGGEDAVLAFDNELPPYKAGTGMDPGKLVLVPRNGDERPVPTDRFCADSMAPRHKDESPVPAGLRKTSERYGAAWLYDELRDRYHLQMEMRTDTYCLAMTSIADSDEGFWRLVAAMREIDERAENDSQRRDCAKQRETGHRERVVKVPVVRTEKEGCMKISAALDAPSEVINLADAAGRICADFVILYPPDVPLIVPGEIYTEEKVDEILGWIERGFSVMGAG